MVSIDCFVALDLFVPLLFSSKEEYYSTDDYVTKWWLVHV